MARRCRWWKKELENVYKKLPKGLALLKNCIYTQQTQAHNKIRYLPDRSG
jgi:hypothetical protein